MSLKMRLERLEKRVLAPPSPEFQNSTHELRAFWGTRRIGHSFSLDDEFDEEVHKSEFADLPQRLQNILHRSGFSCRRQVIPCPDWLLMTLPNLGKKGFAEIRAVMPFNVKWTETICPGLEIERRRREEPS